VHNTHAVNQEVAVNHRTWAAIAAAVALSTVTATTIATSSDWMITTDWDDSSWTVTGLNHLWAVQELKITDQTQFQLVTNINQLPPDPCRGVAIQWNWAVVHNASDSQFSHIFSRMRQFNCKASFTTGGQNTDGSFDAMSFAPSP
jgi:hypothetical protein